MYSPRISFMYLDTLLMTKISKFYNIRFSHKWFFYHLKIFKRYEFSQNLKVVAQKLRPPCPFQILTSEGCGSLNFDVTPFKFLSAVDLLWTNKWCFYVEALSLTVLQWGNANWFCFSILGLLIGRLTRNWLEMPIRRPLSEKENQVFANCLTPFRDIGILIKHHLFISKDPSLMKI